IVRSSNDNGIFIEGSFNNVFQENFVSEHLGNSRGNGFWVRMYCEDNCITSKNNQFIDNIATENNVGFEIVGSFNVLRDNTAETNGRGFRIVGGPNKIINNLASSNSIVGISIGGDYNEVRDNVATFHFGGSGISIGGDYNLIINNSMSLNLYGIGMGSSDNNYVVNNTILQSLSTGIYISYGLFGHNSNNTIEGNVINESIMSGISVQVHGPSEPMNDHRNIFRGNYISQSPPQEGIEGGQGDGIRLDESDENLIEDNIFVDNADSIFLFESSDNVIQNNLIDSSFDSGININSDSNRNFILGNTLSNNFQSGLRIFFSSDTEVVGTIINHTIYNAIVVEGDSANNEIRNVVITETNDEVGTDIRLATPTITNMRLVNTSFRWYFFEGSGDSGSTVEFVTNDGKIQFTEPINGQGVNLSNDVRVLLNLASVDSENVSGFNKSADITLYGLPDFENPIILRDGVPCDPGICSFDSFEGGTAIFSVESWTDYVIGEGGIAECGNGIIDFIEECDDGNMESGDGCSYPKCFVELGWVCTGQPSVCTQDPSYNIIECGSLLEPGIYELQNDLVIDNNCLDINADDITILGQGFSITGDGGSSDKGVRSIGNSGLTIKNLVINNFGTGIQFRGGSSALIRNVEITSSDNGIIFWDYSDGWISNVLINGTSIHAVQLFVNSGASDNNILDRVIVVNRVGGDDIWTSPGVDGTHLINTYFGPYVIDFTQGEGNLISFSDPNGEIRFLEGIFGMGSNLSNDVRIENNLATVESGAQPGFDKSANITLYGLPDFENPIILRDGVPCDPSICSFDSFEGGTAIFSVESW
ncbi:MAG: right-handed parallel beta-helix repeat-containing protein, partial [Bacteroidetes bacterium]|nr:right-handed parallel beta-helix repeat-containing protein [Bacteroidota bacterium]